MTTKLILILVLAVALLPAFWWRSSVTSGEANDGETNISPELQEGKIPNSESDTDRDFGEPTRLPLPGTMHVNEYEQHLFQFLKTRQYVELGWKRDKTVRDTGPYIEGVYYGTHPAVRVYYSPGIMRWLIGGRTGKIPDGAMVIKEQYAPPAIQHQDKPEEQLRDSLQSWTVMVKDSRGSHDGWFWSNPGADAKPHSYHAENRQPYSGFGMYCVRCHASTTSPSASGADAADNEFLFVSLRNIEGFPGHPILFRVDDSWRKPESDSEGSDAAAAEQEQQTATQNQEFLKFYDSIEAVASDEIKPIVPSSYDTVTLKRDGSSEFATSNQCMSCHAGLTGVFGPIGFFHTSQRHGYGDPGVNVSPYGEWRWTPMGLAGRDPVVYAQLESELALIEQEFGTNSESQELSETVVDTCLRCHGAMGHQHFHKSSNPSASLDLDAIDAQSELGAFLREGVSCMICHRMQPPIRDSNDERSDLQHYLETSTTGNLHLGPPEKVYGPYKDESLSPYPMQHALGVKPVHDNYIQSSRLWGTCHTVSLPTIDHPLSEESIPERERQLMASESVPMFRKFHHHLEQSTYLEWLNSSYNNETDAANSEVRSCQECHMSDRTYFDELGGQSGPIRSKIASIQDLSYPDAENLMSHDQLQVRTRETYRRHNFAGLNAWLVELTKQNHKTLGVKLEDFMTGTGNGADQALAHIQRTARQATAELDVTARYNSTNSEQWIDAEVRVTNLAGHRFPSGVGFRRAFLELTMSEIDENGEERLFWGSGRSNSLGILLDGQSEPLPTEFFNEDNQSFQPHYRVIDSEDQAQIYETLLTDNGGKLTTSLVRGCNTVKDNRLLPKGWTEQGPGGGLSGAYLEATQPGVAVLDDPDFVAGSDVTRYRVTLPADVKLDRLKVSAKLNYQALPPYYLQNLFSTVPAGPATRRLHSLMSRLDLTGSPIRRNRLEIAADSVILER